MYLKIYLKDSRTTADNGKRGWRDFWAQKQENALSRSEF